MILSFGFKQDVWDLVDCLSGHIELSDLAARLGDQGTDCSAAGAPTI